ncbi:MAG: hypothetical protein ACRDHZ_11200, partial [Ktedonobacteraceae bacterium]
MSNPFVGTFDSREQDALVARWLYQLCASKAQATFSEQISVGDDVSLLSANYHAEFYPQIPNFALALIKQDATATTRYAPLFFHLLGCPTCHHAYLETYDALSVALAEDTHLVNPTLRTSASISLATTSPKLLVFLCQLLIGEAKLVLRQAHRERDDADAWARALLQQAMQVSRHIMQSTLRQRALRDLVAVASLYTTSATAEAPPGQTTLSYSLLVGVGSGAPRGRRKIRRAEMLSRSNEPVSIDLQAGSLEGVIT